MNSGRLWRWTNVKVSKSVRGGSQRYFNRQRISNNETQCCNLRTDKEGLSYIYPKRLVEEDGIHTKKLDF